MVIFYKVQLEYGSPCKKNTGRVVERSTIPFNASISNNGRDNNCNATIPTTDNTYHQSGQQVETLSPIQGLYINYRCKLTEIEVSQIFWDVMILFENSKNIEERKLHIKIDRFRNNS